jgi:AcrR family transcriptional regulator
VFPISRVTKDPQVRQAELMDTALELFLANGYQKTTVQDIVKHVNVAQGTFTIISLQKRPFWKLS